VGPQEWIVRDNFGERWRLRVVRSFDAIPPPAEDSNSYRYPISRLVYGAFDQFGSRGEGDVARGLLEAYDELTGASLSARVPNLASDRQRLLFHFNEHLQETLHRGAAAGRLVVEHVEPMPWPFLDSPELPTPDPSPPPPVEELEHFLELQIVSVRGDGVGGIACEVTFPSGTILQGTSGPDGLLRLSDVDEAGTALVTLPDLRPFAPADARGSPAGRLRIVQDGVSADVDARTIIEIPPQVYRGRLIGMFFDKSKSFLLPQAMLGIRGVTRYLERHAGAQLLVVGHTDTTGSEDYNLKLSVERAESVSAFLRDDADAWVAWFDDSQPAEKRWGPREVQLMLSALPPDSSEDKCYKEPFTGRKDTRTRDGVRRFQTWRNQAKGTSLKEDGDLDNETRAEVVRAYMELEGTSVPDDTVIKTHGCGDSHPPDPTPVGGDDPDNRRVEVFVFDDAITPAPVKCRSPGCSQYAQWVAGVVETIDFRDDAENPFEISVAMDDVPWGTADRLVLMDSAGSVAFDTALAAGAQLGSRRCFTFVPKDRETYRAEIRYGDQRFVLFGATSLADLETDPTPSLALATPPNLSDADTSAVT
jgi:outer membrane protein OmpA-like peptidoglycan-associated protein